MRTWARWGVVVGAVVGIAAAGVTAAVGDVIPTDIPTDLAVVAPRITDVELIFSDDSIPEDTTHKFTFDYCPDGKVVLGGGARIRTADGIGGKGHIRLTSVTPFSDGQYLISAFAFADPEYHKKWTIDVWAVCGRVPDALGYEIARSSQLTPPSVRAHQVSRTITCPGTKKVLGIGGVVHADQFNEEWQQSLQAVQPSADGRSVTVTGVRDAATGSGLGRFSVDAVAVCVNNPPGYQLVVGQQSAPSNVAFAVRPEACSGERVAYSGGVFKDDALGHVLVDGIYPDRFAEGLPRRFAERAQQNGNASAQWSMRPYTICAD